LAVAARGLSMNRKHGTRFTASVSPQHFLEKQPPRVLCIDDDPNVSAGVARTLRRRGIKVIRAFDGMQGYWHAVTQKPDVIVLDLLMPKGRGDEILECLKKNPQTAAIPVLVLTGVNDPGLQRRMEKLGAARCFSKPASVDDLLYEINVQMSVPA
jgi:DNA-binding response OmpR family regulator